MGHRILFLDVGDSCRGPMAAAWARHFGLDADSAGTMPAEELAAGAVAVMQEVGVHLQGAPRHVEFSVLPHYDRIIALGPDVAGTDPGIPVHETWRVEDPVNQPLAIHRRVRDHLRQLVGTLADEAHAWA